MTEINFRRTLDFRYATLETLTPLVRRVVARNPSVFTADGTATFVVGHGRVALIDPGPDIAEHVETILNALRGETIDRILVTHTHLDHSPAAAAVKRATGAPTYGFGPHGAALGPAVEAGGDRDFVPDVVMDDGDEVSGPGWHLAAVHTPGHTSNHLCFALREEKTLFSGDHVMGWSTSVISPPDGDMAAYLRSLDKLLTRDDIRYLPTHGPAIEDPKPHVRAFIEHRHARAAAILRSLAAGATTIPEIVAAVYAGLPANLKPAAGRSTLAHLIELVARGEVVIDGNAPDGAATDGTATGDARYRLAR